MPAADGPRTRPRGPAAPPALACVRRLALALGALALAGAAAAGAFEGPLVDAHLHYTAPQAEALGPEAALARLEAAGVEAGVVTGTPAALARRLAAAAPGRVLPILGVYDRYRDKEGWHGDADLPDRVAGALEDPLWRGVGELHVRTPERHSPVLHRVVALAAARGLPVMIHGDPAVIDAIFERTPEALVVWAHGGTFPCPDLLRDYLARYPRLYADLSMRDDRVAPGGRLDPDWEWLLLEHADRFMVGVDTFSVGRWQDYARHAARIRAWLGQLPPDVAERIARGNALAVYGAGGAQPPSQEHVAEPQVGSGRRP